MTQHPHPPRRRKPRLHVSALALATLLTLVPTAHTQPAEQAITRNRGTVTLNFNNAEIELVSKAIGVMIGRSIVVDPRVKGQITLASDQPQTVREAYLGYQAALRGLGFAVVESGGLLKIVPEADAKLQAGTVSVGDVTVRGDQVITQIFPLRFENANNLVAVLRPLITANNTINASPGTNALVITDYADNLSRLAKIISALDMPASTDVEVIPLKNAVASDLAPLVQRLSDSGGGTGLPPGVVMPGGVGGAAGGSVLADARSNSLIVRAPNAARLASLRSLIAKLDVPTSGVGPGGGMWVVHLKNADAVKLATVVRAAFAAIGTGTTGSNTGTGGMSPVSTAPQPTITPTAGAAGQGGAATAPIASSAQPSTGGFIQADPATNSLIITAPEPLYRQVRAMIEQLDTRRAQVYIECLIVELSGSDAADAGFQWLGQLGVGSNQNITAAQNIGSPNLITLRNNLGAIGDGLSVGLLKTVNNVTSLNAIARLLQSDRNNNIVSTPNVVTIDNEEARVVVGDNVPFITGQFTSTGTGTTNPFQTIERKDVGIVLRIKPQIGEGGTIRMQIYQESSAVTQDVVPNSTNAGVSTTKRVIESNVIVEDGGIIVLGGLIKEEYIGGVSKVPLLGDIPLVGGLFRSENRTKKRTNLMVFFRPVVLRDAASSEKLSLERYDLIRARQQEAQPRESVVMPINQSPVVPPITQAPAKKP